MSAHLSSYQTALVLLPPASIAERLNPFRLIHDKSAARWTAHITLQFPFVEGETFSDTVANLGQIATEIQPFSFRLDKVGTFSLAGYESVHLTTSDDAPLQALWAPLAKALNYSGRPFKAHVTVGQASYKSPEAIQSLLNKAKLLLDSVSSLEWPVHSVMIIKKDENDGGIMKLHRELFLSGQSISTYSLVPSYPTAHFVDGSWTLSGIPVSTTALSSTFSLLTYNILHDDAFPFFHRLKGLVQTVVDANADVLCLQEVTDESLPLLLHTAEISSTYPFSSRHPSIVCENERNILILSKFPFTWTKLDVGVKYKPVFLASFTNPSLRKLIVAAIHLTAGRAVSPLEQKTSELDALVSHLYTNHPGDDWIIAGDTNWPLSSNATPADDLFSDASSEVTYDPTTNSLASATIRDGFEAQRYDRVYVKKDGEWSVAETNVLGKADPPPSDHFALKVTLSINEREASSETSTPISRSFMPLPDTQLSTAELEALADRHSFLATPKQTQDMQQAFETIKRIICQPISDPSSNVQIHLEAIGSFALGSFTSASDVDCLAVGNISTSIFWSLAKSRVRSSAGVLKLKRFIKNAIVPRMELDVMGVKVDLQYCPAGQLTGSRWKDIGSIPSNSPLLLLPASSLVTLNSFRDILTLQRILPDLSTFRVAHRALKQYLTVQGLSGARFGFLGGFHLTLLLTRIVLSLPPNAKPHHLVRQFFAVYGNWKWDQDMVWPIPGRESNAPGQGYRRTTYKEPMVVLSIERPLSNLTFHASQSSVEVLSQALKHADQLLNEGQSWETVCALQDPLFGPQKAFLDRHKLFIRLDVQFWGRSAVKGRELVGWLESRLVSLLVRLRAAVPEINVRLWPQRFADGSSPDSEAGDLNGFYLFGLSPSVKAVESSVEDKLRRNAAAESSLSRCLWTFEEELHSDKYYSDPSQSTFLSLSHVKRSNLPEQIIVDPFTWPEVFVDLDDDSDEEEEDRPASADDSPSESMSPLSASQRKRLLDAKKTRSGYVPSPTKLRTSTDVLNRLLWDPTSNKDNFVIGYEDRFVGIKECALSAWSRELENEAFIPLHRIVYFKRTTDGIVVWDKRSKIDLIFGSGLGAG
ncbi:hypothetical protein C8J56DRAFT_813343 [Mycena floridula]|nr:hypothetical protein C8J56DRAFT_813343 [Mycena floridula]